ncbi:zinc finger matrin-type protein 4-like [Osmerus mordax]|uniref:zinc finger matrin-type protein 4-like n=1 Tax=Osmerus mordax TaxID=8014 RepID=UPI00350EF393
MKASCVRRVFFTESYCICNAQLISDSQRVAHYESKKHANKVRLFHMLHPEDGGPPSKRLRPDHPSSAEVCVDRNKVCTLCNMFFSSSVVAQSHYQGKTHAKRLRLLLGAPGGGLGPADSSPSLSDPLPVTAPPPASTVSWPLTNGEASCRLCFLCGAWFNNPLMSRQHYEGKRHRRNAARARLLEQLAGSMDATQNTVQGSGGLRGSYTCSVCDVTLNSIEQYHAHLQGSKHLNNLKQYQRSADPGVSVSAAL